MSFPTSIDRNNKRTIKKGLIGDLTYLGEKGFVKILDVFNHKCAYCEKKDANSVEHITSVSLGGGTTISNCIPTCSKCNSKKGSEDLFDFAELDSVHISKCNMYKILCVENLANNTGEYCIELNGEDFDTLYEDYMYDDLDLDLDL